jgi:hypothetical protein
MSSAGELDKHCRWNSAAPYFWRLMSLSTVPRKWDRKLHGSIRSLLLLYLHIPSILTSVAFMTSLSFSFVMDPVIVT